MPNSRELDIFKRQMEGLYSLTKSVSFRCVFK